MFIIIVLLSHASLVLVVYPLNTNLVLIASLLFFVKLTDCHDAVYERVTKNSVRGIWARRSKLDLVGAHINVFTGEWTQKDAGIGTSIDSFYEYLLKVRNPLYYSIAYFRPCIFQNCYIHVL
jgi:hypothetical protein